MTISQLHTDYLALFVCFILATQILVISPTSATNLLNGTNIDTIIKESNTRIPGVMSKECRKVNISCLRVIPFASQLNGQVIGIDVNVWNIIAKKLNLCLRFKLFPNPKLALEQIRKGLADVVIGQIGQSWSTYQFADMSSAVMGFREPRLSYRKPEHVPAFSTILYPFRQEIWTLMIASFIIGIAVTHLINKKVYGKRASCFNMVSVLAVPLINLGQPSKLYESNVAWQVQLAIRFWLPMGSILCHMYRGSLLEFLVAGQLEDPADTFDKLIERNMSFLVNQNSVSERLFRNSPFEHMRQAYQITVVERDGLVPFRPNHSSIDPRVLAGTAAIAKAKYRGLRHLLRLSKKEMPLGSFPHSFLYAKGSWLFDNAEPIVLRLIEAGIYNHLDEVYFWNITRVERDYYKSNVDDGDVVLSLDHLGMIFIVIAIGVVLASTVLFLELIVNSMNRLIELFEPFLMFLYPIIKSFYYRIR